MGSSFSRNMNSKINLIKTVNGHKTITKISVRDVMPFLTPYEINEINNPNKNSKIKDGIYDKDYRYSFVINDHINFRFEILSKLGSGAFGDVLKVYDHKKNKARAIKIIKNKSNFNNAVKMEIELLQKLNKGNRCKYVVSLNNWFIFRKHYCLVFNCLHMNLYEYLEKKNFSNQPINLVKKYSKQIAIGLSFLKQNKIIHCDLKPENILFKDKSESEICIIDFGSSCYENSVPKKYIQTRWYRSPEILLSYTKPYNPYAIDVWSLGCIIYELFTGNVLFNGKTEYLQSINYFKLLLYPETDFISNCKFRRCFLSNYETLEKHYTPNKIFPIELSVLTNFIVWHPNNRMDIDQIIKLKWFNS